MADRSPTEPNGSAIAAQAKRLLLWIVIVPNVVFPIWLYWYGGDTPWRAFRGEESPINWFSSVQCAMLGAFALTVFLVTRYGRATGVDPIPRAWPWALLSFGFFFLSFDERFEFHENIRELYLKPRDVATSISWLKPGDIVLPLYALAGIALTFYLIKDLSRHRRSLILFVSALALIVITAFQDSLVLGLFENPTWRHAQIIAEETGEIWAQALFAMSMILFSFHKLRPFLDAQDTH